jgi:hypothetical protein
LESISGSGFGGGTGIFIALGRHLGLIEPSLVFRCMRHREICSLQESFTETAGKEGTLHLTLTRAHDPSHGPLVQLECGLRGAGITELVRHDLVWPALGGNWDRLVAWSVACVARHGVADPEGERRLITRAGTCEGCQHKSREHRLLRQ